MSYNIYKKVLITCFVTLMFIFILTPIVNNLISIWGDSVIWSIFLYVNPFLSIALVYFGVYAYIVGVNTASRWESPTAVIITGSLFVLLAYGPPLLSYTLTDTNIVTMSSEHLQKLKDNAVNNIGFNERLSSARLVYVETGSVIKYLNENRLQIDYIPDKAAEKKRNYNVKYEQDARILAIAIKKHVIINLLIAFTVSIVFVICFILYRYNKKSSA